jgi:RecJ-like exonuclease
VILPLIRKKHSAKFSSRYYSRMPCVAPFYDILDGLKDTARALANAGRYDRRMPFVIIVDNGSSEEDLLAIRHGKVFGMDFIVVDHHYFDTDVISDEVLVHINQLLVDKHAQYSAGMLCVELSRFIAEEETTSYLAGLSSVADRIENEEYLKIAGDKGYDREELHRIASVVDYVATKMPFVDTQEYMDILLGTDRSKQKEVVALLYPHIEAQEKRALSVATASACKEQLGTTIFQVLDIESTLSRGSYPKPGKVVGLLHDESKEKTVTIGLMSDAKTFRAKEGSGFSVHEFLKTLNERLPKAFAEGGGHELAGSIKFVPTAQKEVLELLREYVEKL